VLAEERHERRLAHHAVRAERDVREHARQRLDDPERSPGRVERGAAGVAHDHHLARPRDRGDGLLHREVLRGVEHHEVHGLARCEELRHLHGRDEPARPQRAGEPPEPPDRLAQVAHPLLGKVLEQVRGPAGLPQHPPQMPDDGAPHRGGQTLHLRGVEFPQVVG